MRGYKVLITQPAADDIKNIAIYIASELREPATAKRLVDKVKEFVMSLSEMPERHSLVADEKLANQGIRKIMADNYIVFYIVSKKYETVTVVRILYARRDWSNLL